MPEFCHLHCHTQYSLLDGAAHIDGYLQKAVADNMKAVAITDHGNMFGVFNFYNSAIKHGLKPILGCEFYVVEDRFVRKFVNKAKDKRHHQLIIAKNATGYRNLTKLCSLGFIDGLYGKFPRIDKKLIRQYSEGLIATSCCVAAEVPRTFLEKGEGAAEKVLLEWVDIFGEDYYIELQRHHLHNIDQESVNRFLLKMANKHQIKVICTNDSHYVDQEDANAHDILLCVNTGDFMSTPKGEGKGYRFGFENDQFYFKTSAEMAELFKDVPQAVENTLEIAEKIDTPQLARDVLLPNYTIPPGFETQYDYLKHITYERAKSRFSEMSAEINERLEYELKVIKDMGFEGYFLIVQDFIEAAKARNVRVGPGRGSAAGSAIAYSIGITNIDPIKYNLLFERFLNPERISMPDIDIDFDDDGRQKVIDYVIDKYGKNQVAQIITYGTMAARSAIRDVGRVMQFPLSETDKLAKLVPEEPGVTLESAFKKVKELSGIYKNKDSEPGKVLALAEKLEGSIRHRGIHAAGVIIAPDDLTNFIPVCTVPGSDLLVTQFDGKVIEDAGMLKMDFLGLKTLTIINNTLDQIRKNKGIDLNIDEIPLDNPKTLESYQRADTIGTFQFESDGMRKYLVELKPTSLEDLIAMNALYRPGPMSFIPDFIRRKHGIEKVVYPHELLKDILEPTYGIMVFQEQIMKTAQIIGGFSLGKADILRRAMSKKNPEEMKRMKVEFLNGAKEKNIDSKKAGEIFDVMQEFAKYGFNRSHSAAYTVLAFQTCYLKTHYPAEFMAAVLTNNMHEIKKLNYFLSECNNMGILTLGPDINESDMQFAVNEKGNIRFALAGIKGVGQAAVEAIVEEREANGNYHNIFDFTKRVNLRAVNKRCMENLCKAGALDCFNAYRSQYFHVGRDLSSIEHAVKFGNQYQQQKTSAQNSLFGEDTLMTTVIDPVLPECEPWTKLELLKYEMEVTGMYVSGHPLDAYRLELSTFCMPVEDIPKHKNQEKRIGGIIKSRSDRMDKKGRKFSIFELEDFSGSVRLAVFAENYLKFNHLLEPGTCVLVSGSYKPRYNSDDNYEFRPSNMELLSGAREKYSSNLKLQLGLSQLNQSLISGLEEIMKSHRGKIGVTIQIYDSVDDYHVSFNSRKFAIDPSDEFLDKLKTLEHVQYQLS
jgi:DNA polymerase III subunit alpha